MHDTMEALNGAGLAAPQIGVSQQVAIFGVTRNPRYPRRRGSAVHRAGQSRARAAERRDGGRLGGLPVRSGHARPGAALHATALSRLRSRKVSRSTAPSAAFTRASCSTRSITCTASCTRCGSATCATSVSTRRCFLARRWSRTTDRLHSGVIAMAAAAQMQISLRDMSLFRQQAFVGGRWEDAASGQMKTVVNPANGHVIGTVPNLGAAETRRAIEAADKALPDWRARTAKERAQILRKWFDLMMANQEDLAVLMTVEQGKPLVESRGEIAYAAVVHRMVRRGRQARLRRCDSGSRPRQAHRRAEAADRRHRRDHAVEFPDCDDHAQGRARARGGLHDGDQAVRAHALLGACDVRARREGRRSRGRDLRRHRRLEADRRRVHQQSDRAQAELHGLDRRGQAADGTVRGDGEESFAGARRQCAVHRVRRRGSRSRGRTARSPRSIATPGRPACVRIASSCRAASTIASPRASPRKSSLR